MPLTESLASDPTFIELVRRDLRQETTYDEYAYLEKTDLAVIDAWRAALLQLLREEEALTPTTLNTRNNRRARIVLINQRLAHVRVVRKSLKILRNDHERLVIDDLFVKFQADLPFQQHYERIVEYVLALALQRRIVSPLLNQGHALLNQHRDLGFTRKGDDVRQAYAQQRIYLASLEEWLQRAMAELPLLKLDAKTAIQLLIDTRARGTA